MFYSVEESGVYAVDVADICPEMIVAGYVTLPELESLYPTLGFSEIPVHECRVDETPFRTNLEVYDTFSFGIINIVNVENVHEKRDRIGLFLKKNMFVLVEITDEDGSTRALFEDAIGRYKQNITLEKVVYGVFDRLLLKSNLVLEKTEKVILDMEHSLLKEANDKNMNRKIFALKNELTLQKHYYEQLTDIGEALQENENDLFEDADLRYFTVFTDKTSRICASTQALCESLVHVREAYEANINYNMNKTMQLVTVITTIFLPLTLIVGWYGMNFTTMPEITWRYGYIGVIVLSIVVIV
ncbi:MAG: CorA family divalent cation transporter, partial [Ruthenibacterium sp.]